ncbi:MAG: glycosyltransferase [Chloroflexota bacterium]|nr:glycosyltransferase [Chloroflexota bacterium]
MKVLFLPDYMDANAYQRELAAGLRSHGVTVTAQATARRRILPVLQAIRAQGRPDVVHLHWTEPYISGGRTDVSRIKATRTITELRLLRRMGMPVVWTVHDLSRHDRPVDPLEMRFNRELFSLSAAVIVHCGAARAALLEALQLPARAARRVSVIPHGHYLGAYRNDLSRQEARERLGVTGDGPVLAFVGWVRPYKGVRELVLAFRELAGDGLRLLIAGTVGSDGFGAELTALAEGDPRVTLDLGFVPDDDLQMYLNAADVITLPYREIFTSGSVLLAMSFGRAVIAPRRGCIGETLDQAGALLYEADDLRGLAGALQQALTADLDAMGAHNRARVDEFDWGRIAASTLAVYRSVRDR